MSDVTEADLPTAALKSALEFAVGIAAASRNRGTQAPVPAALKPLARSKSLKHNQLDKVRRAVEENDEFRTSLGGQLHDEVVDEVGRLWLARPAGWLELAMAIVERDGPAPSGADARGERRRREAAEEKAARLRLEVMALSAQLAEERKKLNDVEVARESAVANSARLAQQLAEANAAGRKAAAKGAADDAEKLRVELASAKAETAEVREVLEKVLAERAEAGTPADVGRLRELLLQALALTGDASGAPRRARSTARREPVAIPGGVYGNSEEAAHFLIGVPGVVVLVDGYNVAKLGWPSLTLEQQRDQLVRGCEALAAARGTNIHIVFDGSSAVEGAHVRFGRLTRVSWSPSGFTADDVLRVEVRAIDPARPVVVVTNDRAIIADVKADGANPVPSDAFLAVLRR